MNVFITDYEVLRALTLSPFVLFKECPESVRECHCANK